MHKTSGKLYLNNNKKRNGTDSAIWSRDEVSIRHKFSILYAYWEAGKKFILEVRIGVLFLVQYVSRFKLAGENF